MIIIYHDTPADAAPGEEADASTDSTAEPTPTTTADTSPLTTPPGSPRALVICGVAEEKETRQALYEKVKPIDAHRRKSSFLALEVLRATTVSHDNKRALRSFHPAFVRAGDDDVYIAYWRGTNPDNDEFIAWFISNKAAHLQFSNAAGVKVVIAPGFPDRPAPTQEGVKEPELKKSQPKKPEFRQPGHPPHTDRKAVRLV
ncbi:hypothetical protein SEUCBS139899_002828 [Sporothrix eucalyptigena]|uniref:DUF4780 domain-containing protein n=1 Tax=Sporothrix eucalyptigena TaxID=1812306 RepID=A0ABP0BX61_9PEZI